MLGKTVVLGFVEEAVAARAEVAIGVAVGIAVAVAVAIAVGLFI